MKKNHLSLAGIALLVLLALILGSCGESRAPFAGTYRSVEPGIDKNYIELNLNENGKGSWTLAGKSVEFTWMVKNGKLWLYTKPGAILIVTPSEGGKVLSADMTGEWHAGCPPNACLAFRRTEGG
jgi:hypothetical protein